LEKQHQNEYISTMKLIRKLLMTLLVTLFFLGVIEGVAGIYLWSQPNIYQGDLGSFWQLRPNLEHKVEQDEYNFTIRTNSLGLRDTEPQGTERWLFLGCSTTLGWGVEQEQGFVDILDRKLDADIINGGQPGWTTQQALMGMSIFKELNPQRIFIGFGVRDAQLSYIADREARPKPAAFSLNVLKVLGTLAPKREQTGDKRRVSVEHFERNLRLIEKSFPQADVEFYRFPQLKLEAEYDRVITSLDGSIPRGFQPQHFFEEDTIHLNQAGHQKLAEWFIANLASESKSPELQKR
jgi:lysophospholipase L1-like esterase